MPRRSAFMRLPARRLLREKFPPQTGNYNPGSSNHYRIV
jgi:hypothetical protein